MTSQHLTGLLLAASTMTLGGIAVVHAQDEAAKPEAAAAAAAEADHGHEHTPTTVHTASGEAFEINDEKAYPDADGFKSMAERVSYAIGRNDGSQIPNSAPDLKPETFGEGLEKGLAEENEDYATGYGQGFELARRVIAQQPEGFDVQAFVAGLSAAIKETDEGRSIGYLIGNSYRASEVDLQAGTYMAGVNESIAKLEAEKAAGDAAQAPADADAGAGDAEAPAVATRLNDEQIQETLQAFRAYMQDKQKQEQVAEGQAYIEGLKAEDGWQKTESGIAYKVIEAGEGQSPDDNDVATMHYEGTLIDGTVFDSSYERGEPINFAANQVIKGWGEMLQLMKPGAIFEVVIPYDLAYGEDGSPPRIPPYAALKFKMEMKSFEPVDNP